MFIIIVFWVDRRDLILIFSDSATSAHCIGSLKVEILVH